jgi:hypothetical protein
MRTKIFNNTDEIIEHILEAFLNHNDVYPMIWIPPKRSMFFSLADSFSNKILNAVKVAPSNIAEVISITPSQYIKSAHNFQTAAKTSKLNPIEIENTYQFLCNCSIIARNYLLIKNKMTFEQLHLSNVTTPVLKQNISALNASLRALCECIYFDDHAIGGDICGPYQIGKNMLIVRDYHQIRPIELHPCLAKLPYKRITTYCMYSNSDINLDILGNMTCQTNIVDSLTSFCIVAETVEGKNVIINATEIVSLITLLDNYIISYMKEYKAKTENEKIHLLLCCEYFALKPFFDFVGINWMPTDEELNLSLQAKIPPKRYSELKQLISNCRDLSKIKDHYKEVIDPRIKWEE